METKIEVKLNFMYDNNCPNRYIKLSISDKNAEKIKYGDDINNIPQDSTYKFKDIISDKFENKVEYAEIQKLRLNKKKLVENKTKGEKF